MTRSGIGRASAATVGVGLSEGVTVVGSGTVGLADLLLSVVPGNGSAKCRHTSLIGNYFSVT